MNTIDTLLEELSIAKSFEEVRIQGYKEILSFPASLLSQESSIEVQEAITWSINRLSLLQASLNILDTLAKDTYPARVQQIAPDFVITELQKSLEAMSIAVAEFQTPPEPILIISEEIPV